MNKIYMKSQLTICLILKFKEYEHHIMDLNQLILDSGRFYIFEICGMDLRENKTCKSISYIYE